MVNSVTFPSSLGGDNSTVDDSNSPTTGLGNNGHRTRFIPALSQTVVMAQTAVTGAQLATDYATKTASQVETGTYSAKEHAIGDLTASGGSAKAWATDAASPDGTTSKSALTWAGEAAASATTATTKASEAAASAVTAQAAAGSSDSWRYLFSTSTTEGSVSGQMRFNNATYTSVTSIFINEVSSDSLNLSTLINTLDDSTSTNKARLTIRSTTTPTTFKVFTVTAVVDNGPYHTISVSPVAGGSGTFANNDPVVVSYRLTGDAGTPVASSVSFTPTGNIAATDVQAAIEELDTEKAKLIGGNTFNGTQTLSDGQLVQAMLKDVGAVYFDKGTVASGTVTFAYTDGSHQRLQVGGTLTIAANAWPPTGNNGTLLLEITNGGAFAITWPTINWIKSDGTTTTTFSNLGITLQASGTDFILLWTRDAGTTIYGKVVR